MIVAIGIDLVETARIGRAMRRSGFLDRVLTPDEREYCKSAAQVAGRWAAKEAVKKCVPGVASWHDVRILAAQSGAPIASLREGILSPRQRLHVSISHEKGHAVAVAILESA
ncbi:MAG: holo-ACP synthase [Fimbriimonadaceae bacterium]|nr:holo-ACP synthase [Fimbriimonadaceae bacterium]QYK55779.1 MAG: holo-ACP synthase [Fimbriimonadaceae bacterium]